MDFMLSQNRRAHRAFSLIYATALLDHRHSSIRNTKIYNQSRIDADKTQMHCSTSFQLVISGFLANIAVSASRDAYAARKQGCLRHYSICFQLVFS